MAFGPRASGEVAEAGGEEEDRAGFGDGGDLIKGEGALGDLGIRNAPSGGVSLLGGGEFVVCGEEGLGIDGGIDGPFVAGVNGEGVVEVRVGEGVLGEERGGEGEGEKGEVRARLAERAGDEGEAHI